MRLCILWISQPMRFPPCSACLGSVCFWGCTRDFASCSILQLAPSTLACPCPLPTPSYPWRPALHLIRAALAKPSAELLGAAQSCSMLTIHPPSPPSSQHLHVKTLGLISSSLEQWHNSRVIVCGYKYICVRDLERAEWVFAKWMDDNPFPRNYLYFQSLLSFITIS